jgi:predicted RND superfamily exporter protein
MFKKVMLIFYLRILDTTFMYKKPPITFYVFLFIFLFLVSSCSKENSRLGLDKNVPTLEEFIASYKLADTGMLIKHEEFQKKLESFNA